jgi:hypothetical protein
MQKIPKLIFRTLLALTQPDGACLGWLLGIGPNPAKRAAKKGNATTWQWKVQSMCQSATPKLISSSIASISL